jgi:ketosteroid isomerase-like protein
MAQLTEPWLSQLYDDFIKGGIGSIMDRIGDDAVMHIFGDKSPLAGEWRGKFGINDFFRQLFDMCEGSFELSVRRLDVVSDRLGVVSVHERARRGGRTYEVEPVHVWQVTNGLATEFWRCSPDTQADDEFWS